MSEPIISVSGLRGIVGESFTPEVALRYVAAYASTLPPGPIVVTRDGRASGAMFADLIRGALQAAGRTVCDAGLAATPTTGVLVRQLSAVGGIQISASHNPLPYNGLKLFSAEGQVLSAAAGQKVLECYRTGAVAWNDHAHLGRVQPVSDPHAEHLRLVLDCVDVKAIRARRFRVLLDSNHGAGSLLGKRLLEALGCEITLLGGEPDGAFAHPPEPTAANLAGVCSAVTSATADVGFCQDPDADRLALIDETGRYIGEEYTLALCVDHVLAARPGTIVINGSTSRMSVDLAARHGAARFRSAVGEANVVAEMQRTKAVFGGEGNGGPIDPRVGYVRDSFVGMAILLSALAQRQQTVSQLVAALPRYEIHKTSVTLAREKLSAALDALQRKFADAAANTGDGLRLEWANSWLQVRGSNTEPIVRIIAEAASLAEAQRLCAAAGDVIAAVR